MFEWLVAHLEQSQGVVVAQGGLRADGRLGIELGRRRRGRGFGPHAAEQGRGAAEYDRDCSTRRYLFTRHLGKCVVLVDALPSKKSW